MNERKASATLTCSVAAPALLSALPLSDLQTLQEEHPDLQSTDSGADDDDDEDDGDGDDGGDDDDDDGRLPMYPWRVTIAFRLQVPSLTGS